MDDRSKRTPAPEGLRQGEGLRQAEERLPYSPPAIVFEHVTEALAAACSGGMPTCPSKDSSGTTTCDDMGIPRTCESIKS